MLEKEERVSWFSYSLQAEKSLKVAVRGLAANTAQPQDQIIKDAAAYVNNKLLDPYVWNSCLFSQYHYQLVSYWTFFSVSVLLYRYTEHPV